jgi:transketolase
MTLLCPADAVAAKAFVRIAADIQGPVYLRLGRGATPVIYDENQKFEFGKAICVRNYGKTAVIIVSGPCVGEAAAAADKLNGQNIATTVLDMHTIKPIDRNSILEYCKDVDYILTVEDGTIYGLGSAIAEVLMENGIVPKRFRRLGLTTFGTAGSLPELLNFYGIDAKGIAKNIRELVIE